MDSTVESNILTLLSNELTYFFGSSATWTYQYSTGSTAKVQAAQLMGYASAAIAFFFSVSGAIQAGAKTIYYLESSFWSFLSDFQKKDKYINMLEDEEKGKKFKGYMEGYALDTAVLVGVQFWHVFFLMGMGIASAFFLLNETSTFSNTSTVPISTGFKLIVIGMLVGSTNYLAGRCMEVNNKTILQMIGFEGSKETSDNISQVTTSGSNTYTIAVSEIEKEKKNFYYMFKFQQKWGLLFLMQNLVQEILPYMYIALLETAVLMVFSIQMLHVFNILV